MYVYHAFPRNPLGVNYKNSAVAALKEQWRSTSGQQQLIARI